MTTKGIAHGPERDIPAAMEVLAGLGRLPPAATTARWVDESNGVFTTDGGQQQFRYTVGRDGWYTVAPVESPAA